MSSAPPHSNYCTISDTLHPRGACKSGSKPAAVVRHDQPLTGLALAQSQISMAKSGLLPRQKISYQAGCCVCRHQGCPHSAFLWLCSAPHAGPWRNRCSGAGCQSPEPGMHCDCGQLLWRVHSGERALCSASASVTNPSSCHDPCMVADGDACDSARNFKHSTVFISTLQTLSQRSTVMLTGAWLCF